MPYLYFSGMTNPFDLMMFSTFTLSPIVKPNLLSTLTDDCLECLDSLSTIAVLVFNEVLQATLEKSGFGTDSVEVSKVTLEESGFGPDSVVAFGFLALDFLTFSSAV